jgi:hypothetical protein
MTNSYLNLRNPRQWKSVTGLSEAEFHQLVACFKIKYEEKYGIPLSQKIKYVPRNQAVFKTYEDLAFFGFFQLKNSLTYDSLGFVFQTDGSNAQRTFNNFINLMEPVLQELGHLPKRTLESVEEFETLLGSEEDICIDGTEIPIQRPENEQINKMAFSGKKKGHRIKNLIVTNLRKRILYVSGLFYGSVHDYTILKTVFDKEKNWFEFCKVRIDLGFLGFGSDYLYGDLSIPHKKKRGKKGEPKPELSEEQKIYNKAESSVRVVVEHSIGGMKRFRFLGERIRLKSLVFIDKIIGVCAGLWNFHLST